MIGKADEIREDLGAASQLFHNAAHRRLVLGEGLEIVKQDIDRVMQGAAMEADTTVATDTSGAGAVEDLAALPAAVDLSLPGPARRPRSRDGHPRWGKPLPLINPIIPGLGFRLLNDY